MSNIFEDDEHLADPMNPDEAGGPGGDEHDEAPEPMTGASMWVSLASQAYNGSTDWWHSNYYRQWERNLALFRSEHPSGSKYHTDAYKYRSRLFRPKTRAAVRRAEAAAALAFFGSDDVVSMQAENENDPHSVLAAEIRKELLNERLGNPDPNIGIPWFRLSMGAYQDANVMGAVCSHQYWEYEEREVTTERAVMGMDGQPAIEPLSGEPVVDVQYRTEVIKDKPACELVPLENIRFDPAADWLDPVASSPYLVHLIPMFICDIKARMLKTDTKTQEPAWFYLDDSALAAARQDRYNSVRQAREGSDRQDPYTDNTSDVGEYEVVWVHKNIIRKDGEDWLFYTLGESHLLSEPVPLREVYWHGMRPYTWGSVLIETHRSMPSSPVQLASSTQVATNDVQNQRFDNVKLTMNKRYFVRRGGNVDIRSLTRNIPGSGTAMDDPNTDVKVVETPDVTGSAYQEQDRLNLDFDEIIGTFSPGSVASNRKMNETVGGMNLISQDSNTITEYAIRCFAESWMQSTLAQLDALEVHYESDQRVLQIAGQRSAQWKRLSGETGQSEVTPEMVRGRVALKVRVGYGATNPTGRIERLMMGFNAIATMVPGAMARAKEDELIDEVFGILGYKGAERFFMRPDDEQMAQLAQLQQQVEQLTAMIEERKAEAEAEAQTKLQIEQMKAETDMAEAQLRADTDLEIAERNNKAKLAIADANPDLIMADRNAERDAATKLEIEAMRGREARRAGREKLIGDIMREASQRDAAKEQAEVQAKAKAAGADA